MALLAVALAAANPIRAGADPVDLIDVIVEAVQVVRSFRCMVVSAHPMLVWVCWFS